MFILGYRMYQGRKFQKKSSPYSESSLYPYSNETVLKDRSCFQSEYGILIYNYPLRFLKIDSEKAGDFYLYVFEKDRIFKRLANFRGERISLANYLKYHVLKDMCLEWIRATSLQLNTESLDDPESNLENCLSTEDNSQGEDTTSWMDCVMEIFRQPPFLILRLLYLADFSILADDIRFIAAKTGRELVDVVNQIAGIENQLGEKQEKDVCRQDQLAIQYWRRLMYQKRLVKIESELLAAGHNRNEVAIFKLTREKLELERKYAWRLRQVEAMTAKGINQTGTTPYNDIAELMMTTVGTVSAKIYKTKARLKSEVSRLCGEETL
jgi:RNA polymerase sigma factor (sigma-70 family)